MHEVGKAADSATCLRASFSLGVPRAAVHVGAGSPLARRSLAPETPRVIARVPPAVSANARVTPRAGKFPTTTGSPELLASCPSRSLRLACATLNCFLQFRFLSTLLLTKGREETSWWGGSTGRARLPPSRVFERLAYITTPPSSLHIDLIRTHTFEIPSRHAETKSFVGADLRVRPGLSSDQGRTQRAPPTMPLPQGAQATSAVDDVHSAKYFPCPPH